MTSPAEVITRLYTAFAARDAETMARCYAPDAHFSDPVFPDLHGPAVTAMWPCCAGVPLTCASPAVT